MLFQPGPGFSQRIRSTGRGPLQYCISKVLHSISYIKSLTYVLHVLQVPFGDGEGGGDDQVAAVGGHGGGGHGVGRRGPVHRQQPLRTGYNNISHHRRRLINIFHIILEG